MAAPMQSEPPESRADAASGTAELIDFVYREARLLDEKRYEEWYELFTDDARYWMPLTRGQPDGRTHTSLFYEDKLLLKVRLERLSQPSAFSEAQLDRQLILGGLAWHHLARIDGRLRMRLKKVELVNCDAALPSIQLFP